MRSGIQTRFWQDCWLGSCPLKISHPNLYNITSYPELEVSKAFVNGQWVIQFRRQLDEPLSRESDNLLELLSDIELTNGRDQVFWFLESSKKILFEISLQNDDMWGCD